MNRATLRQFCWDLLGVKPTDAFFTVTRVDTALNVAEHQIADEIRRQAPDLLRSIVTLTPDVPPDNQYQLLLQTPPIVDFLEVLVVRLTDSRGLRLEKIDDDLLDDACASYSLIGADASPRILTSPDIAANSLLYLKYGRRPPAWDGPTEEPATVHADWHDVIGFAALELLFPLGGESSLPPDIARMATNRRGALWHHMGGRSLDPQKVRGQLVGGFDATMRR